jgi:DNA-binding HxlR family transcriptional regulator
MSASNVVALGRFEPSVLAIEKTSAKSPMEVTLQALEGRRPLIVWHLFWGARSFSELMRSIPGITKKVLRRELAEMERQAIVSREVRLGGNRKADYSLTPLGQSLKPVVAAMYEWGLLRMKATPSRSF